MRDFELPLVASGRGATGGWLNTCLCKSMRAEAGRQLVLSWLADCWFLERKVHSCQPVPVVLCRYFKCTCVIIRVSSCHTKPMSVQSPSHHHSQQHQLIKSSSQGQVVRNFLSSPGSVGIFDGNAAVAPVSFPSRSQAISVSVSRKPGAVAKRYRRDPASEVRAESACL